MPGGRTEEELNRAKARREKTAAARKKKGGPTFKITGPSKPDKPAPHKRYGRGVEIPQQAGVGDPSGVANYIVHKLIPDAKHLAVALPVGTYQLGHAAQQTFAPEIDPRFWAAPLKHEKERLQGAKKLGQFALGAAGAVEAITPNPTFGSDFLKHSLIGPDKNGKGIHFWVPGGETGDTQRAKEAWVDQPLTSALTALSVVAPAVRVAAIKGITSDLMSADASLSRTAAVRLARREVKAPGFLAKEEAAGRVKGGADAGVKARVLVSKAGPNAEERRVTITQSRSPLGREFQKLGDTISRKIPEGKVFSERQRANRAIQRATEQAKRQEHLRVNELLKPVRSVGYTKLGKSDKGAQALMVYALQTPRDSSGALAAAEHLQGIREKGSFKVDMGDGRPRETHELMAYNNKLIDNQVSAIHKALDHPPDSAEFSAAVDALEELSVAAERIGLYVAMGRARGATEATANAIRETFAQRRNQVTDALGLEGEARGYFPHTADLPRDRNIAPTLSTSDTMGKQKSPVTMKANRGILFRSGEMSVDPQVLVRTYFGRLKFLWAENALREIYHEALPLSEAEGKGRFVRNPDAPVTTIGPGTKHMADTVDAQAAAADALDWDTKVHNDPIGAAKDWVQQNFPKGDTTHRDTIPEEWAKDVENVRWIPEDIVKTRLAPMFMKDHSGFLGSTIKTMNSLTRLAVIQGKIPRYVASNTVQNLIMAGVADPAAVLKGAGSQASLVRAVPFVDSIWKALRLPDDLRKTHPELYDMISGEGGDIAAEAGLPEIVRPRGLIQKVEQKSTTVQHKLGHVLGKAADTPYRNAVWMRIAKEYKIRTPEQIQELLTSETPELVRVRQNIAQQTRDIMLDFDRLSPSEREGIARFAFIWPFVRASVRYPVTFTRDYPTRTGLMAGATSQTETGDGTPVSSRDLFTAHTPGGGEFKYGSLIPHGQAIETLGGLGQLLASLQNPSRIDGSVIGDFGAPWLQSAVDFTQGKFDAVKFAKQSVPFLDEGLSVKKGFHDGGLRGALKAEPGVSRFTAKKGRDRLSPNTMRQYKKDEAKITAALEVGKQRGAVIDEPALSKSFNAYWLYREYAKRATYGAAEEGSTKLTDKEKALLLTRVAKEAYPELDLGTPAQIRSSKDDAKIAAYVKYLEDGMFGPRSDALALDNA